MTEDEGERFLDFVDIGGGDKPLNGKSFVDCTKFE